MPVAALSRNRGSAVNTKQLPELSIPIRRLLYCPISVLFYLFSVFSSLCFVPSPTEAGGWSQIKPRLLFNQRASSAIRSRHKAQRKGFHRGSTTKLASAWKNKKLYRKRLEKEIKPSDSPAEAQEFYRLKRAPDGKGPIPVERYLKALDHIRQMPQYSTRLNRIFHRKTTWDPKCPMEWSWAPGHS